MVKKLSRLAFVFILVCFCISAFAVPALAYDARADTNITIAGDTVIDDDLYLVGTNITIDGTVNGDIFIMGRTITVNGTVDGGATIAAQTININGNISRSVRLAAQTVTINGSIDGDVVVAASDLIINQTAVIGRDLILGTSTALIGGSISRNVLGASDEATISNQIEGNVNLRVTNLLVTSEAGIGGDLTYTSRNQAVIQQGAEVTGTVDQVAPPEPTERPERGILAGITGAIIYALFNFIAVFIIGLIIIAATMRHIKLLARSLQYHPAQCLGWGALIFFATPIAAFIVMFTIVGIPLALTALVVWGVLLYLSQIPVALTIGWLILSRGRETASGGFLIGALALGLFLLYAVGLIPIFGWILWFFVVLFGLGTLVTVFRISR